jgi:sugar phosphate isomerase/epimerase
MCTAHPASRPCPDTLRRLLGRRGFLKAAGAAGAAMALGAAPPLSAAAQPAPLAGKINRGRISIQLYSLRELMSDDLDAVFAGLAQMGYTKVEHAGFHGRSAEEFKAALDAHGLRATSGHSNVPYPFDEDEWRQVVADAVVLGQSYIVEPLPQFAIPLLIPTFIGGPGVGGSGAQWADYAGALNRAAAIAAEEGIRVGYHNHNVEFFPLVDNPTGRPYDVLLAETDPDLVHFEMDLYWVWNAEQDPIDWLNAHPARFRQFHVKDMDEDGNFANPGEGIIDFERIFATVQRVRRTVPIREFIAERDDAGSEGMQFADVAYSFLRDVRF